MDITIYIIVPEDTFLIFLFSCTYLFIRYLDTNDSYTMILVGKKYDGWLYANTSMISDYI